MRARVTVKVIKDPETGEDIQTYPTQGSVAAYPAVISRLTKLGNGKDEWKFTPPGRPPTYFKPW